jgi:hypothetical protein
MANALVYSLFTCKTNAIFKQFLLAGTEITVNVNMSLEGCLEYATSSSSVSHRYSHDSGASHTTLVATSLTARDVCRSSANRPCSRAQANHPALLE